jgi:hypothetical protein
MRCADRLRFLRRSGREDVVTAERLRKRIVSRCASSADTIGEVSGTWVLSWSPASEPGLLFYVMVDNVSATGDAIVANGGEIRAADSRGCA